VFVPSWVDAPDGGVAFLELGPLNSYRPDYCVGKACSCSSYYALRYKQRLIWIVWGRDFWFNAALTITLSELPDAQLASRRGLVMYRRTPYASG